MIKHLFSKYKFEIIGIILVSICLYLLISYSYSVLTFLSCYLIVAILLFYIFSKYNVNDNVKYFSFSFMIFLFILEVSLRTIFFGQLATGPELNSKYLIKKYESVFTVKDESYLYKGLKNVDYCLDKKEFEYCRIFNEFGIPHITKIDTQKNNILFLGDSFTEGMGVNQNKAYPNRFCEIDSNRFNCINAGIAGSDIYYAWKLFQNELEILKPTTIVYLLNTSDVIDVILRGTEREREREREREIQAPIWEPLYASSYIVRLITKVLNYSWTLENPTKYKISTQNSIESITHKIDEIFNYCSNQNIKFYVILHPFENECKNSSYDFKTFELIQKDRDYVFNTLPNLESIDNYSDLYWKYDKHFNEEGYYILAKIIHQKIGDKIQ